MRVLYPWNSLKDVRNGLFLAGPATRTKETLGWREEFIKLIEEAGYDGDILNPENPRYGEMGDEAYDRQTQWEYTALRLASVVVFWIPRSEEHPAFTTNIEYGEWMDSPHVYVGWPEGSIHNRYIETRCGWKNRICYSDMETMIRDIMLEQNRPRNIWFTSDTHFGVARTLRLSWRPFMDVKEMDLELISNWNKRIGRRDVVFHLGDFGELETLRLLTFGTLYMVGGNHDDPEEIIKAKSIAQKPSRVFGLKPGETVSIRGKDYRMFHEPLCDEEVSDGDFCLFGHIHRAGLAKRNGINVGCDLYHFTPITIDQVEFLRRGVEEFYDENVFSDKVEKE